MARLISWVCSLGLVTAAVAHSSYTSSEEANDLEGDVQDILEMVPYADLLSLGMAYASSDTQTVKLLQYFKSEQFKKHVQEFQSSEEFVSMAGLAGIYNVDIKGITDKVNTALDVSAPRQHRFRRSPGDGVMSLVKEAVDLIPVNNMKEMYHYKLESNPRFKDLMDKVLSDEAQSYFESFLDSQPLQDTRKDLSQMDIPIDQVIDYISEQLTDFFEKPPETEEES